MVNLTKNTNKHEGVALLLTGSELMSGDIVDSNSAMLALMLADIAIEVTEKCTLSDDKLKLAEAIERLSLQYSCLIINGGLGPTSDDLTVEVIADTCDSAVYLDDEAERHVRSWCDRRGQKANKANLKQALLPKNAVILPDSPGSAVAFYLYHNDCLILVTPGVPSELKYIMQQQGCKLLKHQLKVAEAQAWQRFILFGIGESELQQLIDTSLSDLRLFYVIGYRAGLPTLELKLKPIKAKIDINNMVLNNALVMLAPYVVGQDQITLAESVVKLLREKKQTISFAESCTGGLIASEITKIPGSSVVFPGSIVSYSNAVKSRILGVDKRVLDSYGAVSQEVAESMHAGILATMKTDYAIAVTGVAGPDGGSKEKPVGTVWLAWGSSQQCHSIKLLIKQPRQDFQKLVSAIAFDLIRRQLLDLAPYQSVKRWISL